MLKKIRILQVKRDFDPLNQDFSLGDRCLLLHTDTNYSKVVNFQSLKPLNCSKTLIVNLNDIKQTNYIPNWTIN